MPSIDKQKFSAALKTNALPPFGQGKCARFVRLALEAAGADTTGHPVNAKEWGPTLLRIGFIPVAEDGFIAQLGDIAVIQGTSESVPGHIEGFDGTNWVSDFIQHAFWPGPSFRNEKPAFVVYRWPV
jgi:hypothetical protein